MTKFTSSSSGFDVPADLANVDPRSVVPGTKSSVRRPPPKQQFVQRMPSKVQPQQPNSQQPQVPTVAKTALTEHRQPPDSQYLTTGLPSGCVLYPQLSENSLGVRRFNNDDVLKIYDARAEKSIRMLAEVVGSTLDSFSVWDLTVGDFWFLLYWHRLHSYPKHPFIVDFTCTAEPHLKKIRENEASIETINQQMMVKRSDLQIKELIEDETLAKIAAIKEEFGVEPTIMRMGDYVRMVEMDEENDTALERSLEATGKAVGKYAPSTFIKARHASALPPQYGESLDDRMVALTTVADFSMWTALDELVKVSDHGVIETYKVRCKCCDTPAEVEVALDALTFLPQL
jgi:hypothetical protein